MNERALGADVFDRLILVVEVTDYSFVVDVIGNDAKSIILGYAEDILLRFILTKSTV
jgi:hypothetical protein